ncbi:MAG: SUMF1/EgtB/PvdO family nonheme iron enzyme [Planctomycetota bacterium]|nr:SUMF1/EgtB/PvdO family nonheme iron enzyme [Planctomycetota bacterium]
MPPLLAATEARVNPGVRGALVALLLPLCALAPGCAEDPGDAPPVVAVLERLGFVPPGATSPWTVPGSFVVGVERPLLVDLFEVRRGDFLDLGLGTPEARGWTLTDEVWDDSTADLPAYADWSEAVRVAELRGMRLPTASEWLYIAAGRIGHRYPWGKNPQRSVANTLELDLLRPAPVGAFESGRGPFGTYDQIGNVWEWVADLSPDREAGDLRAVMGGSYLTWTRPLWTAGREAGVPLAFFAQPLDPGHRAVDVGFRCVAEAEEWLWRAGLEAGRLDGASAARVRAVGADWVQLGEASLLELLDRLAQRPDCPDLIRLLLQGARS